jgi:uncharacterized protein YuzE
MDGFKTMRIHYDQKSDSLYINFSDRKNVESEEIVPGFVLDFDSKNKVVGVEIDHASSFVDLNHMELDSLPNQMHS